ncbi:MAG: MoxR family ATPase [Pseudomonadota bacterium]
MNDPQAPAAPIPALIEQLRGAGYVCDQALATVVFLSQELQRPLLLEGEAGVGKTEIATTLARATGRKLVRLQCYEGLDVASAAYEWNYARQLLHIRTREAAGDGALDVAALETDLFADQFLIRRPLLQALEPGSDGQMPILLIDELDRADAPFEAFLLELLADYAFTIPERGRIAAPSAPLVILTSNRTREVHDAVRRRCLYHWVDYPGFERELAILHLKVPEAGELLRRQVVAFIQSIRGMDLYKNPGIAEAINWAQALTALSYVALDATAVDSTLGTLLKYQDDIARVQGSEAARVLQSMEADAGAILADVAETAVEPAP